MSRREIDTRFPHQVVLLTPTMGFGNALLEMHEAAEQLGEYKTRGLGRLRAEPGQDGIRWCFMTEEAAAEFCECYGGEHYTALVWFQSPTV